MTTMMTNDMAAMAGSHKEWRTKKIAI